MADRDVMKQTEAPMFSAEMNLAAGKKAFIRNMQEHPLFGQLSEFAKSAEGRAAIAERVSSLAAQSIDARYENPADVAFCAYLRVLEETAGPEIVAQAASAVLSAPNCSWAIDVSREALTRSMATGQAKAVMSQPFGMTDISDPRLTGQAVSEASRSMLELFGQGAGIKAPIYECMMSSSHGALKETGRAIPINLPSGKKRNRHRHVHGEPASPKAGQRLKYA